MSLSRPTAATVSRRRCLSPPPPDEPWSNLSICETASFEPCLLLSFQRKSERGCTTEKDLSPNRDRPKASPLASPQQPMSHVFLRRQIHLKLFSHSPPIQYSAPCFYRHRRPAHPSSFFILLLLIFIFLLFIFSIFYTLHSYLFYLFSFLSFSFSVLETSFHLLSHIYTSPSHNLFLHLFFSLFF